MKKKEPSVPTLRGAVSLAYMFGTREIRVRKDENKPVLRVPSDEPKGV